MLNAFNAPEAMHIMAQDGEGNRRMIRYIREDLVYQFADNAQRDIKRLKEKLDRNEPYKITVGQHEKDN